MAQCCVVVGVAARDDLHVQKVEESRTESLGEMVDVELEVAAMNRTPTPHLETVEMKR